MKSVYGKLLSVQKALGAVPRRGRNPFTKSDYVTLDDLLGALKPALNDAGLVLIQTVVTPGGRAGSSPLSKIANPAATNSASEQLFLNTIIVDPESGEKFETSMPLPAVAGKNEAQSLGAAITYARRYSLSALFGIAAEDDTDGEPSKSPGRPRPPKPGGVWGQDHKQQNKAEPVPPAEPRDLWDEEERAAQQQEQERKPAERPYDPATLRTMLIRAIDAKLTAGFTLDPHRADNLRGAIVAAIDKIADHHEFASWLGIPASATQWDDATLETLRRWLSFRQENDGSWSFDAATALELAAVMRELNPQIPGLEEA